MDLREHMVMEGIFNELKKIFHNLHIDTQHDIPYLAGYSQDGTTLYIDRDFPEKNFYEFIAFHEISEKFFESTLSDSYQSSHELATKLEHYLVSLRGFDPIEYEDVCQKWIKICEKKELKKCPKDLDLQPYLDEHDDETIHRIKAAQND